MPGLPTTVAGSTCPVVGGRGSLLGWCLAEAGCMLFLVAGAAVHLSTRDGVVKAVLFTFGEGPSIQSQGCLSGGGGGSANRHYILFLGRILGRLAFLIVPELPFVVPPFRSLEGRRHSVIDGPMVNELSQMFGTVKGSRFCG